MLALYGSELLGCPHDHTELHALQLFVLVRPTHLSMPCTHKM